jgi:putative ABC transport system permease protein
MAARVGVRLDAIVRDARLGARMLRKDLLVTAAAGASLALAIGACLAAFALVDALILRPLPVPAPHRLVHLSFPTDGGESETFSDPLFRQLRDASRGRADLFAMSTQVVRRAVVDPASAEREEVRTQYVSGDAFARLGVGSAAGRLILPSDDTAQAVPVAVLSEAYWRRRFGGDQAAIGRSIVIEERPFEIVGISRRDFSGVEPGRATDVWMPYSTYNSRAFGNWNFSWFRIFGRLNDGVRAEAAEAAMQATFTSFRREYATREGRGRPPDAIARFVNAPLHVRSAANGPSPLRRQFERPLWVLACTALLLFVIAGSNLANLFLARTGARGREMALRTSIGASRARLAQQVLIEGALLAAPACALGLVFAQAAAPAVVAMLTTPGDPIALDLRFGWRPAIAASALATIATALFGLLPAVRASRVSPIILLKTGDARSGSRTRAMRPFVALQMAVGTIVVFVGGLLIMSFARLSAVEPGFAADVLLVSLEPAQRAEPAQRRDALIGVLDRVRRIPAVASVSAAEFNPLGRAWTHNLRVPGTDRTYLESTMQPVTAGYFDTMRIPIVAGRPLDRRDLDDPESKAVVVNEAFARKFFGDVPAVGRTLDTRFFEADTPPYEVVGIAADTRYDLRKPPAPTIYLRLSTRPNVTLQVRAGGGAAAIAARLRDEIRAAAPLFRVTSVTTQGASIASTLLRERLLALLAAFFGAIGVALAAVGLYGVLTYSVAQRTHEIGIRAALGARPIHAVRAVTADAGVAVAIGAAAGLAGGVYLSRFVTALLFEVTPLAWSSLAWPLGVLLMTAAAAAILPAVRAARLDPAAALRH